MSLAKFRKVGTKTGAGRFVVSPGIAPAAYLLPSAGLPTWYLDSEDDLNSLDADSDEFGASDAEAGGTEPEGREQRESREFFETTSRILSKLAGR